jgi:3-deoxy-D-manno-octulosonate 8-phosphate phosphatase KdsC-like HAD superfamily phosphatase
MHARIRNHGSIIVIHGNGAVRKHTAFASAAHGGKGNVRKIAEQMLHITAAMPADTDQADAEHCR